jgi:hypothetical protein
VCTGTFNTFVGYTTGKSVTTGDYNTMVGDQCGALAAADSQTCSFVGYNCGNSATGSGCTLVGSNCGFVSGSQNTFMGSFCARYITGTDNTAIGYHCFIGTNTPASNTASRNVFIGEYAAGNSGASSDITTASDNVVIGYSAATFLTTGSANVFIGPNSGNNATTSSNNICVGNLAGITFSTSTGRNVFIGTEAGKNTTGGGAVIIGYQAGRGNCVTDDVSLANITAVGVQALSSATGAEQTALGFQAGLFSTSGVHNVFIGDNSGSGSGAFVSSENTCVGHLAGNLIATGNGNNTLLGYKAGCVINTGYYNVAVGSLSLAKSTTGYYNTCVGFNTAIENVGGAGNTCLGYYTGSELTSNNNNTLLGREADVPAGSAVSVSIGLGFQAVPSASYTCVIGSLTYPAKIMESDNGHVYQTDFTAYTVSTTITGAHISGGLIDCFPGAGQTYTFDTALNICATCFPSVNGYVGRAVGSTVYFLMSNRSVNAATLAITDVARTTNRLCSGVIAANSSRWFAIRLSVASATPTIVILG